MITYACVKIAVLEICSEKNNRESVVRTFKNICTVSVYWWYINNAFALFCQQIFFENLRSYFRENWQKAFVKLSRFWLLRQKSFSDNVEQSSKKL